MKTQNSKLQNTAYDRLYGKIDYTEDDKRLFQTKEITRLRQVSLSAVPPWVLPTSNCATKFEHSLSVGYLARIICQNPKFKDLEKDLYFAALAHDVGTPPFSHISEIFQIEKFGLDHEQFIDEFLDDSEFAKEVKRQGGNINRVSRLIKGEEKPYSDILNGSIDIDNLDNSLRYSLSMGLVTDKIYSPESLARAFDMEKEQIILKNISRTDLEGWEKGRTIAYEFVYSKENLPPANMISRAIELAVQEDEIEKEYFYMTDAQAYQYLEQRCNKRTSKLMRLAREWKFYQRVYYHVSSTPSQRLEKLAGKAWNRCVLSDELSTYLHVDPADVCVSVGKNKGFRKIHLPIFAEDGKIKEHIPQNKLTWLIQVYIHPSLVDKSKKIEEFIKENLLRK